jgi:hypothetical protein
VANYIINTHRNNNRSRATQEQHNHKTKEINELKLFIFKHYFLKISVDLQTVLAGETHQAAGQSLEEKVNVVKLRVFRAGTRIPAVSRTEGQHLAPLKTFIKNRA